MPEIREEVRIKVAADGVTLIGDLTIPEEPWGAVLFAHGSGSGRRSPRNRFVAEQLHTSGLTTLLLDLLTEAEESAEAQTRHLRFDIDLLARRLVVAADWLRGEPWVGYPSMGVFGASTGAGAALKAAAQRPDLVAAVVSRGGRPDLAHEALADVRAPTLLVVGGRDEAVLTLNERALERLGAPVRELTVVPGASHLFEEPGALEEVARLASAWFGRHLCRHDEEADD